ncbi:MAG: helix-turn-helix transcriptional regulator, partial [Pseudomonadota bacterium]
MAKTGPELLRAWRLNVGLGGEELASQLGVSRTLPYAWEVGRRAPNNALRYDIEEITDGAVPVESWGEGEGRVPEDLVEAFE